MNFDSFKKTDLVKNITVLIDKNIPLVANLANISRLLEESFSNVLWSGFYLTDEVGKVLYLGPFQGPLACTTIPFGKGVCGLSALNKKTYVVPNVHEFSGHIACSSLSNSEIVVPIIKNNNVVGVIDIDSKKFNNFNEEDQKILEEVALIISSLF
ncbi:MAG: GAF domain-containing protein [Bacilli bacterium]|nr:GAF domain-containing protein [Bacilli bacterium]